MLHFEDEMHLRDFMTQLTYQKQLHTIHDLPELTITFELSETMPLLAVPEPSQQEGREAGVSLATTPGQ